MIRYEKTISNLKEVKARSGMVIALATEGDEDIKEAADHVLYIPPAPEELLPILEIVPLAAAGLPYRRAARLRCGSTAESGKVSHGGVDGGVSHPAPTMPARPGPEGRVSRNWSCKAAGRRGRVPEPILVICHL